MKRKFPLHWQILIGLILGVLYGGIVSFFHEDASLNESLQSFTKNWITPFGKVFINSLKLIAVPLVLFSLVNGIASLKGTAELGAIGGRAIAYYLITTVIAVTIGLFVVNTIQPWNSISKEAADNIITSYSQESSTKIQSAEAVKENGPLQFIVDLVPDNIFEAASLNENMLQVIVFALLFGVALITSKSEKKEVVKSFFQGVNDVILKMVDVIMYLAPVGTFALVSTVFVSNSAYFSEIISGVGGYFITVILALLILVVIYLVIIAVVTKIKPLEFLNSIAPAQLLAFSSSSSAAALPVTMECVNENIGVEKEVTSFVLPLGATINMDGTSCYQAVAAVFIANVMGVDLSFLDQVTIVFTATLASIGSAAVPGAGIVMLAIVLGQLNVPMEGIGLIIGVDRLLDMCRTVVNVTGDSMVAIIIGKQLGQLNRIKNVKFDDK